MEERLNLTGASSLAPPSGVETGRHFEAVAVVAVVAGVGGGGVCVQMEHTVCTLMPPTPLLTPLRSIRKLGLRVEEGPRPRDKWSREENVTLKNFFCCYCASCLLDPKKHNSLHKPL